MRLRLVAMLFLMPLLCGAASRSFDGTNDNIDMGNVIDVTTGDVSVCIVVKMTEDATGDIILGKKTDAGATAGYSLYADSGDLSNFIAADGTESANADGTSDIDGVWTALCGTWTASTETTNIFVNGVSEDTTTTANIDSLTTTSTLRIGETSSGATDAAMLAAYGRIHSAVLTTQEIAEGQWHPDWVITSLQGFWPLWGDATEIDLSGNGFTGTVSNATTSTDGPPVMIGDAPL